MPRDLAAWLAWQETLHPNPIDLGLERVAAVWARLHPGPLPFAVVTVGGTNGKGSTVAYLEAILCAAGCRVGAYTSPHLLRYNERVRIDGVEAGDAALCAAFERIDAARSDTSLTYFEFGTLAALELFARAPVEVALLEVGLGGRLDAVNVVDPDVAVVTTIDLDHTAWLGEDREAIGREKAGIFRPGRPALYSDRNPPQSLLAAARACGARLLRVGRDYELRAAADGWEFRGPGGSIDGLPRPALAGGFQLDNAATALAALQLLAPRITVTAEACRAGLATARLAGRFQHLPGPVERILDVAHNPQAARALAANLAAEPCTGRTYAVFGMLADKDVEAVAGALRGVVDGWYLAGLEVPRGLSAAVLEARLAPLELPLRASLPSVAAAWRAALQAARPGDRVLACGSFFTVAEVMGEGL